MRFRIECMECGNAQESPEGRDPTKLEEANDLIDQMGLLCRECHGPVTMRLAEGGG